MGEGERAGRPRLLKLLEGPGCLGRAGAPRATGKRPSCLMTCRSRRPAGPWGASAPGSPRSRAHQQPAPIHPARQPKPRGPLTMAIREPMSMPKLTPCSPKSSRPGYLKSTSMVCRVWVEGASWGWGLGLGVGGEWCLGVRQGAAALKGGLGARWHAGGPGSCPRGPPRRGSSAAQQTAQPRPQPQPHAAPHTRRAPGTTATRARTWMSGGGSSVGSGKWNSTV